MEELASGSKKMVSVIVTNKIVIGTPSSDSGTSSNVIKITDDGSGKLISY